MAQKISKLLLMGQKGEKQPMFQLGLKHVGETNTTRTIPVCPFLVA